MFTCSYRRGEISSCTEFLNQIIAEPINDNADFVKCTSCQAGWRWWSSALKGVRNVCVAMLADGWSPGLKGYNDKVIDCPYCRRYLSVCTLYFSCSCCSIFFLSDSNIPAPDPRSILLPSKKRLGVNYRPLAKPVCSERGFLVSNICGCLEEETKCLSLYKFLNPDTERLAGFWLLLSRQVNSPLSSQRSSWLRIFRFTISRLAGADDGRTNCRGKWKLWRF